MTDHSTGTVRNGDLLIWSNQGSMLTFGFWVRLFTRSHYSHVGIAYWLDDVLHVLEAHPPRVRLRPLERHPCDYWIGMGISHWNPMDDQWLQAVIGDKYSYWEAVTSLVKNAPLNRQWQCAEFVLTVYKRLGLTYTAKMTPSGVVQAILQQHGKCLRRY